MSSFGLKDGLGKIWMVPLMVAMLGCSEQSSVDSDAELSIFQRPSIEAPESQYKFEPGRRLLADGTPIAVETPGYACPTLTDFDDDGVDDLVVGQFSGGRMKWYRNSASAGQQPVYAAGEWVSSGGDPAVVPGVW